MCNIRWYHQSGAPLAGPESEKARMDSGNFPEISTLTVHGPDGVVVTFGEENFELGKLPSGQTHLTLLPETLSPAQRAAILLAARRGQRPAAVSIGFSD